MKHKFVILIGTELHTYENYEDIPESFDNVIEFKPYIPEEHLHEHTDHDHDELSKWNSKLKELMKRERK
jgi:hypothetical protein